MKTQNSHKLNNYTGSIADFGVSVQQKMKKLRFQSKKCSPNIGGLNEMLKFVSEENEYPGGNVILASQTVSR